jgi:hypothetical protein
MAAALAQLIQPGTAVILPHVEAGRLATAMLQAEKPLRLRTVTSTHTSIECTVARPTVPPRRLPGLFSLRRAVATGVICMTLSFVLSGCGGGADLEEADGQQQAPVVNCVAQPEACK